MLLNCKVFLSHRHERQLQYKHYICNWSTRRDCKQNPSECTETEHLHSLCCEEMKSILFFAAILVTFVYASEDSSSEVLRKPKDKRCPVCGSGKNPKTNECFCDDASTKQAYKYACGTACDALGYCCNVSTTSKNPKMKCGWFSWEQFKYISWFIKNYKIFLFYIKPFLF